MTTAPATARQTTYGELFAVREFRVLFGGNLLGVLAETMRMLALAVLVFAATGSALLAAFAYTVSFLPQVLGGAFLLALADRLPPRAAIVAGGVVRTASTLAVAAVPMPVGGALALLFAVSVVTPVFSAAGSSLLPEVVPGDSYVLARATFNLAVSGAQIASLGAGGLVLGFLGPRPLLYVAAALALVAACWNRFGLTRRPARTTHAAGSPVAETLRGNARLLADHTLRGLLLAQWLPVWLLTGAESLAVPYVAWRDGSASGAGFVLAAVPVGMLVGDLVVGRLATPPLRERAAVWLALLVGAPLVAFALHPPAPAAAVLYAAAAFGLSYELGLQRAFLAAIPDKVRGQTFGLLGTGLMTGQGLGAVGLGALADAVPPGLALGIGGAAAVLAVLLLRTHFLPHDGST